jgi:hypothetical protein
MPCIPRPSPTTTMTPPGRRTIPRPAASWKRVFCKGLAFWNDHLEGRHEKPPTDEVVRGADSWYTTIISIILDFYYQFKNVL